MKKLLKNLKLFLLLWIIPSLVLAYSNEVILGGQNIGIELDSNGVIIVGTYEVNKESPAKNANLKTIGVSYTFKLKDLLESNPDYMIDDLSEIIDILGGLQWAFQVK